MGAHSPAHPHEEELDSLQKNYADIVPERMTILKAFFSYGRKVP